MQRTVIYNNGYQTWEGRTHDTLDTIMEYDYVTLEPAKFRDEAKPGKAKKYNYDGEKEITILYHNIYSITT